MVPETGVSGAAVFPEPMRLECGPGIAASGDWSKIGALECYSGGAWYRKTVTLTPEQARGDVTLDLGKVVATAEVRVNGQLAGIRVAPPWRVDISKQVQARREPDRGAGVQHAGQPLPHRSRPTTGAN